MSRRVVGALLVTLCCLSFTGRMQAAEPSLATVSGTGMVSVSLTPTWLRTQIPLRAYGKTPRMAIQNLETRRKAIVARLKEQMADPKSIAFGTPRVGLATEVSPASSYPSATPVMAPAPSPAVSPAIPSAAKGEKTNTPPLFAATTTVRAQWALPSAEEGLDRIATAAAAIQDKVRLAHAEGSGKEKLSPEEQEFLEEAEMGMAPATSGQPGFVPPQVAFLSPVSGQPAFVFVGVLSDAQRKAALAQAYAKAKKDAAELAAAAGMQLGPIQSLNRREDYSFSQYNNSMIDNMGASLLANKSEFEAVAIHADRLEISVDVAVSFCLAPTNVKP
ncbi:MAG: SIMPL domain-containing protein [Thermoguttaceae bacterium]